MGRWDDRPVRDFDQDKPSKEALDEWNKAFDNDFDWKETEWTKHPKGCNCPKHEYFEEQRKSQRHFPIVYKYCPDHFKAWYDTKDEMMRKLKWWQRQMVKFLFWRKLVIIKELTHAQSDLCIWCRFGSGGRGIKTSPLTPDIR